VFQALLDDCWSLEDAGIFQGLIEVIPIFFLTGPFHDLRCRQCVRWPDQTGIFQGLGPGRVGQLCLGGGQYRLGLLPTVILEKSRGN
jgi:hypothetical protein